MNDIILVSKNKKTIAADTLKNTPYEVEVAGIEGEEI